VSAFFCPLNQSETSCGDNPIIRQPAKAENVVPKVQALRNQYACNVESIVQ